MSFDKKALIQATQDGAVVRIVILKHAGSAPRETGTSMLVWADRTSGTIGGGTLELRAIETARQVLQSGVAQVEKLPLGPALGQCCGGAVTLGFEKFEAHTIPTAEIAARPLIRPDKTLKVSRAIANCRNGQSRGLVYVDGWVIEPITTAAQPVWIYGAGHVGHALIDCLAGLPFDVTWVDDRRDAFPTTCPENVTPLFAADPVKLVAFAPPDAQHLVLSYSHELDLALCHAILSQPHHTLGLIGSRSKLKRFSSRLQALGHSSAQISRINCPIGDPTLGKEPKSIAIGVVAALLRSVTQVGAARGVSV